MKKLLIAIFAILVSVPVLAQKDYSGAYGYSLKPSKNTGNEKNATGPNGNLTLLKIENNKYRFWLDVTIGWPSYNSGETDGTITIVNDTASFDNTFEGAASPCILKFSISGSVITLNSLSSSFNCGFGNGVHADGEYTRLKSQPIMNNEWLKKQYQGSASMIITVQKAELFQDENGVRSYAKPQYFVKGDSLLNISETEKTVYTEFFTASGKFVYGWINKTDVKMIDVK
jgi:uncharacterized protein YdeI (BOF family)